MKKEINTCCTYICSDENNLETGGVWEDAGFKPPQFYMQLIEFLHIMFLNEGHTPEHYLKEITGIINAPCNNGLFVINDREKMYSFAETLGVNVLTGDADQIAADITGNIILDYVLPDFNSIVNRGNDFS